MNNLRVICNASPVIGLFSIQKINLLWELFNEVIMPEAVFEELCADSIHHKEESQELKRLVSCGKIQVCQIRNKELVKSLYGRLHFGELEVIIGAKEQNIKLAIIDEKSARKLATEFLVDTIGILGILLLAKQKGLLTQVKPELDKLKSNGYRISHSLHEQVLKRAKEN